MNSAIESKKSFGLTPYDIMGYLLPGVSFVTFLFLFELWYRHNEKELRDDIAAHVVHTPVYSAVKGLYRYVAEFGESEWTVYIVGIVIGMSICYVLGHLVASFSAFFIDRVFIAEGHGYPTNSLLEIGESPNTNPLSKPFFRGMYFWVNSLVVLTLATRVFKKLDIGPSIIGNLTFPIFLLAVMVVVILAMFIGSNKRRVKLLRKILSNRSNGKKQDSRCTVVWWCYRCVSLYAGIYNWLISSSTSWIHTGTSFDNEFRKRFFQSFSTQFGFDIRFSKSNNFWLPYIHVIEESKTSANLVFNWLRLYAFARNMAMTFYLSFLYCAFWIFLQYENLNNAGTYNGLWLIAITFLYFLASQAMLVRYYYLYTEYFTKYVLRAFVYLCRESKEGKSQAYNPLGWE